VEDKAKLAELKQEAVRVRAKMEASDDKDIVAALKSKLESLEAQITSTSEEIAEEEVFIAQPATMLRADIDHHLKHARLALNTGRKPELKALMDELESGAPDDPEVLELKADLLIQAKNYKKALPILKRARTLAPKNVNIESKLAEVAIKTTAIGSIEDQLRGGIGIAEGDFSASATSATIFSAFIPGSGHIFIGQNNKGIAYLTVWILCVIAGTYIGAPVLEVYKKTGKLDIPMLLFGIGFIALMVYMIALFEIASLAKKKEKRVINRPTPPANLPFE
jgi:tetratricopeptide (TPR) repeat protein